MVKVLMMVRLDWSGDEKESVKARGELRRGWREGLGIEGEEMEVERGDGWKWVEEVGKGIVSGLEGGEEEDGGMMDTTVE